MSPETQKIRSLFLTYLKIGTFTIGGGYVMLSYVQREVVDRHHWLDEQEFLNMIALAQAAPGLIAVNSAIFVGHRIAGWKGTVVSVLGSVLPSFIIILAIAMLFPHIRHLPVVEAIFMGIRPAVVALIAATVIRLAKKVF